MSVALNVSLNISEFKNINVYANRIHQTEQESLLLYKKPFYNCLNINIFWIFFSNKRSGELSPIHINVKINI